MSVFSKENFRNNGTYKQWYTTCDYCKEGLTRGTYDCLARPKEHSEDSARHWKNRRSFEDRIESEAIMLRRAAAYCLSNMIPDDCTMKILAFAGLPPVLPTNDATNGKVLEAFCPNERWRHSAVKEYLVTQLEDESSWVHSVRDGLKGELLFLLEPRCRNLDKDWFLHNLSGILRQRSPYKGFPRTCLCTKCGSGWRRRRF